eukprot:TRINITY_DN13262_c0_g1_i1.p1 TRINITY_DN13262_c0_g1~~TRINITY_DN13262_c0_g1_i1.p1  ORF type:complete len:567 (-),score=159.11 TRINITY_DN13262_c0_g1_i1:167-1867(-)
MPRRTEMPDDGDWEEPDQPDEDGDVMKDILADRKRAEKEQAKLALQYAEKMQAKETGSKAAALAKVLKIDPSKFTGRRKVAHEWISWWVFDAVIGMVITANAFTIGWESQIKTSVPIGCTPECDCRNQIDPSLTCHLPPDWIATCDFAFWIVYVAELLVRFFVYGPYVLKSHWIKFDFFLVLTSSVDMILKATADTEAMSILLLIRMLRLARLARAVRLMVQFATLWQLVQGLFHSIGTLMWTFLLVLILMYIGAIVGMELIKVDETLPLDHPYNVAAGDNFADFYDAGLTLLQIFSFDSIGGIYRPLIKQNWFCFFYFMLVMLLLSIALMNLVTAVMVNSSLDQASEDKEAKKAWEAARKAKQMEDLKKMFLELDEDGSGELTMDEINAAPPEAQEQLQEIAQTDNLEEMFDMLDYDGGGTIGVEEFCEGVLKATGSAPGVMELGRLVKQCADILKNSRESLAILEDDDKGFKELAKTGKVSGSGGGGGGRADLSKLDAKVTGVEKEFAKVQQDISKIHQLLSEKSHTNKLNKSSPAVMRNNSGSPSRKHGHDGHIRTRPFTSSA